METLPLKVLHYEWISCTVFLWAKCLHANAIHSAMHPVYAMYANRCVIRLAILSLIIVEKALLIRNDLAAP